MSKLTEHSFTYRVYVEDTDILGIVYHANHLRFLERARTEMLRDHGLSLTTMAIYDTHFAIHDIHICYLSPARLDDVLTIKTICEHKKTCSLMFEQVMSNQLNQVLCKATVQVVCVNKNLKPKRIPKAFVLSNDTLKRSG